MAFQQNIISALGTIANLAEFNKLRTGITSNQEKIEEQKVNVGDLNKEVYKTGEFTEEANKTEINQNNQFKIQSNKDISKRDGYYKKIRRINKELQNDLPEERREFLTERLKGLIEEKNKLNARMKAASATYSAAHDFFGSADYIASLTKEDNK